jgi:phospholipid/cholesterol/gamma-HCH transport system permease protein
MERRFLNKNPQPGSIQEPLTQAPPVDLLAAHPDPTDKLPLPGSWTLSVLEALETIGHLTHFAIRSMLALPACLLRPRVWLPQLYAILLGALPLGLTAGVVIGAVIWMHLRGALQMVGGPGAVMYLPQALALAVVLEFGPIAAGLLVAGRTGASLGAELGSMRQTEQIDALEVLGQSPMRELVAPRVFACLLALPILTIFIIYLALAAGYAAEALGGSMTFTQYRNEVLRVLHFRDVLPAVLKTTAFGYLIGVSGCYFGTAATGGTEGVGRAATYGVVASIFFVLVADVVLVRAIKLLV